MNRIVPPLLVSSLVMLAACGADSGTSDSSPAADGTTDVETAETDPISEALSTDDLNGILDAARVEARTRIPAIARTCGSTKKCPVWLLKLAPAGGPHRGVRAMTVGDTQMAFMRGAPIRPGVAIVTGREGIVPDVAFLLNKFCGAHSCVWQVAAATQNADTARSWCSQSDIPPKLCF